MLQMHVKYILKQNRLCEALPNIFFPPPPQKKIKQDANILINGQRWFDSIYTQMRELGMVTYRVVSLTYKESPLKPHHINSRYAAFSALGQDWLFAVLTLATLSSIVS